MRMPGEDRTNLRLTEEEWRVLRRTDIKHGASFQGTKLLYKSAFAWSYECMAQWDWSLRSAKVHQKTLCMFPARHVTAVRHKLLKIPNMNTTGRLPTVLLVHLKL